MSSELRPKADARRRQYTRLIAELRSALLTALAEEQTENRLTRKKIADVLGKDKASITRILTTQSNITMQTLSDLAYAMNRKPHITLVRADAAAAWPGSNSAAVFSTNDGLAVRAEPKPSTSKDVWTFLA